MDFNIKRSSVSDESKILFHLLSQIRPFGVGWVLVSSQKSQT